MDIVVLHLSTYEKKTWKTLAALGTTCRAYRQMTRFTRWGPRASRILAACAKAGDLAAVEACLACGADPDVRSLDGYTPLMEVVAMGDERCCDAILALLDAGADASASTPSGWTALWSALLANDVWMVRTLLRFGADPAPIWHGTTPLRVARQLDNRVLMSALLL